MSNGTAKRMIKQPLRYMTDRKWRYWFKGLASPDVNHWPGIEEIVTLADQMLKEWEADD